MKKLFIFSIFILCFSTCKKTNEIAINNNELQGEWLLKSISGGIGGGTYPVTDTETIRFEMNEKYAKAKNSAVIENGTYNFSAVKDVNGNSQTLINFYSTFNETRSVAIELKSDSLFLSDYQGADGQTFFYVKQ